MASTSASPSIQRMSFKYDVFISFRGVDTRKNFVDHLYHALVHKSILTYKDDEKIKIGGKISEELITAIKDSRLYVIVFSKNYASSSWCLDELVQIMEECHKSTFHTAYPVFFDVEPTEIRYQSGAVREAFSKLEKQEAAGKWREALKDAADLSGLVLKNMFDGHEAKFIQKIVETISLDLRFIDSGIDGKLIGMESRVKGVVSALEIGSDDVLMIGIKGMGGAGKTTLARAVYDHISIDFEGKSFVENVREVSKASLSGLKKLQKQVLSDILNEQGIKVSSVHDGINMMKKMMRGRKVLVVLDDVDHIEQLEALAGEPNWFKPGSRILVTTRDEQVLVAHRVNVIRDVNLLSDDEAVCLFSRYAFGKEIPIHGYEELSRQVVRYAAGLPLTIRVLGSFLCGKDELEWKDAIDRLKTIPLRETLEKLELSYNGLEEDYKEIFLDVACMMKWWDKDDAIIVLESCGFHARNGLRVLEQKSLITISDNGYLGMHDHIEEMGKNIVRRLHPSEPNRHSRLWIQEEIEDILANDLGTEATRCINMEIHPQDYRLETFIKGLGNMKKLRVLDISGRTDDVNSSKLLQSLPSALRYLRWDFYPFESLMKSFQEDHLVGLCLHNSNIQQLWKCGERKVLKNLKFLDIRYSNLRTLDLEMIPNIETVCLDGCVYLVELNMPLECPKLKSLELDDCTMLRSIKLAPAPNLEKLYLAECYDLLELHMPFPKLKFLSIGYSPMLRTLNLGLTLDLETLSLYKCDDLLELNIPLECSKLKILELLECKMLRTLNLGLTFDLKILNLYKCHNLIELNMPLECSKLEILELSSCKMLRTLNLGLTFDLKILSLYECHDLLELNMPLECSKLEYLILFDCKMLRTLNLGPTPNLFTLRLERCLDLLELHMPFECSKLEDVRLIYCKMLRTLELAPTPALETFRLEDCHDLLEFHMPGDCPNLKYLSVEFSKLRTLNLGQTSHLVTLSIDKCPKLKSLSLSDSKLRILNLGRTSNLVLLSLENCPNLIELKMPFGCPNLKSFSLTGSKLRILDLRLSLDLETLSLARCHNLLYYFMPFQFPKLKSLTVNFLPLRSLNLGLAPNLETLSLEKCPCLIELIMPFECSKLKSLNLESCTMLRTLNLAPTPDLETLNIGRCDLLELHMPFRCPKLKSLKVTFSWLRTLNLGWTPDLEMLSLERCLDLLELYMPCPKLKALSLLNCPRLRTLEFGPTLGLETLSLEGCHNLLELHVLNECPNLKFLRVNSSKLRTLNLEQTSDLETLSLEKCPHLVELHMPFRCRKLKSLSVGFSKLRTLNLWSTPDLERLCLTGCHKLSQLHMPFRFPKLKALNLNCAKLRTLEFGPTLDLETLSIHGCDLLELNMPNECPNLKSLGVNSSKLRTLNLGSTPDLETLCFKGCHNLIELNMPLGCPKLKSFSLSDSKLRTLNLGLTPNLERLDIKDCFDLVELHCPIGILEKLVYLNLSDCRGFKYLLYDKSICPLHSDCEVHRYMPVAL